MNIPQEFEDVFQGVELTEDEIRTLTWITGWESQTVENLKSAIQKVKETALSTLQAENEKLRAELEQVKSEKAVALEHQGHNATWYDIGASGAHCSRCHYRAPQQSRYCPHCGAKMERREKP